MKNETQDLIIIGGGIMGLFTAYYASNFVKNIVILEKSTIGNKQASSFSFTRSIRNDYLDPFYARLAYEAQSLWIDLQEKTSEDFLIKCGCLNIAKKNVTLNLLETYAMKSYQNIKSINLKTETYAGNDLQKRFPQFDADLGCLDINAGFLYLPIITKLLLELLKQNNVQIIENAKINSIEDRQSSILIQTNKSQYTAKKMVITSGIWVNDVLKLIKNCTQQFSITPDRPQECKYYYPSPEIKKLFMPDNFPVFAYLDVGIYGHPIFDKQRGALKIGYYNPPDVKKKRNKKIQSIDDFINECLPILKGVKNEPVTDADQCSYDLVSDDNFILGQLPNFPNISIGTGWRGTGYKFAPLIGKILMQLSLQVNTVYDISRFNPNRFNK